MIPMDRRSFLSMAAAASLPVNGENSAVEALKSFLLVSPASRPPVSTQDFASQPLSKEDAAKARALLAVDALDQARAGAMAEKIGRAHV